MVLLKGSYLFKVSFYPGSPKRGLKFNNYLIPYLHFILFRDDFPSISLQVLNDHCDEVWFCEFSNNGKRLASGSKDGCLIIWDVDPNTYKLTLNKAYDDHVCGVAFVAWSPDDRYVIVCGTEECSELWIWDVDVKIRLILY